MPDYDFYHGLYSGQQVDSAVARALVGGQLDQDIAAIRAAVGSPLVANTAAEMTNINKIYVYTGSEAGYSTGHWYYYEGGEWNDGGLYNSAAADSAMSDSSTNAVQNKVIKEYVDDVRTDLGSDIADVRTDLGADILAEQTRAENVEALKAPLASPALTGTPTAPTAAAGTANTQIATTAYADNAVAVEKARAEAVEATKAGQSFAEYILLREEEDRQILFGSIVEAAEDAYSELRAAPIHNAITIGGSVYPRMDRTRMAIDAIKGRTVAFNQLVYPRTDSGAYNGVTASATDTDGSITVTGTFSGTGRYVYMTVNVVRGHKYLALLNKKTLGQTNTGRVVLLGDYQMIANMTDTGYAFYDNTSKDYIRFATGDVNGEVYDQKFIMQLFDLTADYGTTLADSIYAMEQATTGAGVAYVRQRLDLDYYASNAGELKAPVVSGVGFIGKNRVESMTTYVDNRQMVRGYGANGGYPNITASTLLAGTYTISLLCKKGSSTAAADIRIWYRPKGSSSYVGGSSGWQSFPAGTLTDDWVRISKTFTLPEDADSIALGYYSSGNYVLCDPDSIMIESGSSMTEFAPYTAVTLSLPSTRLDGVGTAQDVMYVREDGDNDYALIKTANVGLVDLGTLAWTHNVSSGGKNYFVSENIGMKYYVNARTAPMVCPKYTNITDGRAFADLPDKSVYNAGGQYSVNILDDSYSDAATFKTAMNGVMLVYELATPTETVLAEHLTLADISAIAENGGIISIVNENGHIVQPDMVCDVVVSRSAS